MTHIGNCVCTQACAYTHLQPQHKRRATREPIIVCMQPWPCVHACMHACMHACAQNEHIHSYTRTHAPAATAQTPGSKAARLCQCRRAASPPAHKLRPGGVGCPPACVKCKHVLDVGVRMQLCTRAQLHIHGKQVQICQLLAPQASPLTKYARAHARTHAHAHTHTRARVCAHAPVKATHTATICPPRRRNRQLEHA